MVRNPGREYPVGAALGEGRTGVVHCPRCKKESRRPSRRCSHCGYSFLETRAFQDDDDGHASSESLIGRVINEKYRIVSLLGEGGFGAVYKVELLLFDTGNTFALKLLHPSLSQDQQFRRRFLREAGLAMQLIHENTIQIREFGRTEEGSLFFTMDYCEGESLNAVIAREGFLTVNRALDITQQILSVMQLAHSRGIIHRDLKPENVFLERQDRRRDFVKVGDFGLAKSYLDGAGDRDITHGGILGTPRYMSPEQARGSDDLDHRSDLYSIGVMLYEMLYGEVHEDNLLGERAAGMAATDGQDKETAEAGSFVRPPDHPGHVVPQAVWQIVSKALAPRRRDRFQSAEEFFAAIEALPSYTPSYMEPQRPAGGRRAPWWRRLASALVVALSAALLLSLAVDWLPGFGTPEAGEVDSTRAEAGVPETAGPGAPLPEPERPIPAVSDYLPLREGSEFTYEISDARGPKNLEITFRVLEELEAGLFQVRVSPDGRLLLWRIDDRENVFWQEFPRMDPETGERTLEGKRELLRLPPDGDLSEDFVHGGFRLHSRTADIKGFRGCLVVESREGVQRRLQYYKKGLGLVALEVYEPGEPQGQSSAEIPVQGRLVYARYLKASGAEAAAESGE